MKTIYTFCVAIIIALPATAQETSRRFGFNVGAGTAITLLPSFEHRILIANGMVIPNYIHPSNSMSPLQTSTVSSKTNVMPGWYLEAGASYRISDKNHLTFSATIRKLRYDYQTTVSDPGPVSLDDLNDNYGKTSMLYLTLTPFNLSKTCFTNKVKIGFGPVVNILLSDKTYNVVAVYNSQQSVELNRPDKVYFDTAGKFNKTMIGANLDGVVTITGPLSFRLAVQYFFSSVYDNNGLYMNYEVDAVKPFVVQGGLTYAIK